MSIVIIEISLDLVQAIATVQVAYIYVYLETIMTCIAAITLAL